METIAVTTTGHQPAGEFVNDDHLTVFDHIIDISFEQMVSLEGLIYGMDQVDVIQIIEVGNVKKLFGFSHPVFIQGDRSGFLVQDKMFIFLQPADEPVGFVVKLG